MTAIELLAAISVALILSAMAVPAITSVVGGLRIAGDAQGLANQMQLAKLRAGSDFTHTRLFISTDTNSYSVQLFNAGAFATEGGNINLSSGVTFGLGTVGVPAGTQAALAQTTKIEFNSRGIPVNAAGAPTGADAVYLTNQQGQSYAVSVNASGQIKVWRYTGAAWKAI